MTRHIYIAGEDRYGDLEKGSLTISQALTYAVDTCQFSLKGEKPTEGQEVIVEDGARRFGGIITKVQLSRTMADKSPVWAVDCDDYTALLDSKLVIETYSNESASDIFLDIAAKYCPDFTVTGVQAGAPDIEYIAFDYVQPSECFKRLCEYVGWQWQPDYYKDLQFFSTDLLPTAAPLELTPGGPFRFGRHTIDTQNLRNKIYVRGGTMLSDPQTISWKADGEARQWSLPWGPHDVSLTVGGTLVSIGVEYLHDEADYDYMFSFTEKYLRASSGTTTPVSGVVISLTGTQDMDVITIVEDLESQAAVAAIQGGGGIYEHNIVDSSLTTIEAAEAAGLANLREYGNPKVTGDFETEVEGWRPGQIVTINLPDRGVTGEYLVQKVTLKPTAVDKWTARINYGGRLLGIADFLKALISTQQQRTVSTSLLHKYTYIPETVSVSDELMLIYREPPYLCGEPDAICGFAECS